MTDYNKGEFPFYNSQNYLTKRPDQTENPEMSEEDERTNQTVPGQVMSMQEILERSTRGQIIPTTEAVFLDQEQLDRIRSLPDDLTDLDALADDILRIQQDIDDAIKKREEPNVLEPDPPDDPDPEPNPDPEPDPQ